MIFSSVLVISGLSRCALEEHSKGVYKLTQGLFSLFNWPRFEDATRDRSPAFPQIQKNSHFLSLSPPH